MPQHFRMKKWPHGKHMMGGSFEAGSSFEGQTGLLIDREQIDGLIAAAGVDATREILDAFRRSTDGLLAKLREDLARGDFTEAARTAHAIKGSSANVGALMLSSAARSVEEACKTQDCGAALGEIEDVGAQFAATLNALDAILAEAA